MNDPQPTGEVGRPLRRCLCSVGTVRMTSIGEYECDAKCGHGWSLRSSALADCGHIGGMTPGEGVHHATSIMWALWWGRAWYVTRDWFVSPDEQPGVHVWSAAALSESGHFGHFGGSVPVEPAPLGQKDETGDHGRPEVAAELRIAYVVKCSLCGDVGEVGTLSNGEALVRLHLRREHNGGGEG